MYASLITERQRYMSDTFPSWYQVQIRFRDLDPLAHVNNTVYFTYFEEARSYYFDQLHPWLEQWPSREEQQEVDSIVSHPPHNPRIKTRPDGSHYGLLVKEITCTYELPLVRSDRVEVGVRVARTLYRRGILVRYFSPPSLVPRGKPWHTWKDVGQGFLF